MGPRRKSDPDNIDWTSHRHDWVPLKEYFERILKDNATARQAELAAANENMRLTAAALKEKLHEMNQLQRQIDLERSLYVRSKDLTPIDDRLRKLEDRWANLDGRFWTLGVGLTVLTTVLSLALRFWAS